MGKLESKFLDKIEVLNKSGYFKKFNDLEKNDYKINAKKYLRASESEKLWMDNNFEIILEKYQNGANTMLNIEKLLSQIRNVLLFFFVLTLLSLIAYFLILMFS